MADGVDARRLLAGDELPLYFPANNGREPLYIYLQAISIFFFGPNAFALRLVSALIGVATVAAIYHLAKTLFAALIAAAGIAVSFWHVSLSRLAFRAILLPLISVLAFSAFWIGWRDGNQRAWIWAGVALAAAQGIFKAARSRFRLIWLAVMLTPTIFSNLALHALRSIGALPPLALLYGAGAGWVLQRVNQSSTCHRAGTGLLLLVVLGSGSLTTYDYFVRWAGQAQLGANFDLERYLAAQRVAEWLNSDEQRALLLSQALYQTPQMQFVVGDICRARI